MDYKIGDKVNVTCNSIAVGSGVVEHIDNDSFHDVVYRVKLDEPITHAECLVDDLELISDGED